MQKRRMEWNGWILPVVWLLSVIGFIALYCYACAVDGEWTTGFIVTTMFYYLLPQGFVFGVLFGRKEGGFWKLGWLLPVYYFLAAVLLLGRWGFEWAWLYPAGAALLGLLLGFFVHQIRKKLRQR